MKEQGFIGTPEQMEIIIEGLRKQIGSGRTILIAYETEANAVMTAVCGNPLKVAFVAYTLAERLRERIVE